MYDIKYAPFADSYIGMAHGDTYEHVKRWLKQRFTFVDTLFDYAPSYNNDVLTIRANTTELMTLEIETYTPVYQHLSWYNGQMDKKKIDGKVSVEFSGTAQAATDQEVLIYGGSNVKSIKGITSMNPNRMLIGSATKLVEIDAHDCPLLADINANKANLSPHEYLNKVDLSNCPLLEGNLRLNNSPLVQEINIKGTNITGMNLPSSIRNLQVLRLPNTMTELTLNDAGMLHTLEFDEGVEMKSIAMTNCNALENVINFDLLQTPSITLNNSYNTAAELYFRDTTNLSLSNMPNLERVIFTPNNEYETFELINVANAPDYKVTTFNCPKLSTFMTTAPYRESFNNCGMKDKEVEGFIDTIFAENYKPRGATFEYNLPEYNPEDIHILASINISTCLDVNNGENILSIGRILTDCFDDATAHFYYIKSSNTLRIDLDNGVLKTIANVSNPINIELNKKGLFVNDEPIPNSGGRYVDKILKLTSLNIGSCEGDNRSNATYNYIKTSAKGMVTIQVKDYDDIQPNTTFTANSIDISSTQFTDVKLLCTTDTNTLKLPTTVKNFYCDSSFDLDTDYLEDGEYDVVHGELVKQYTTDYEGEVSINRVTILNGEDILTHKSNGINSTGELVDFGSTNASDLISVSPNETFSCTKIIVDIAYYDRNKTFIKKELQKPSNVEHIVPSDCYYIRVTNYIAETSLAIYTIKSKHTPNLIPSSADGSLIFSMYAPSNTVAPASGTWDLKGLEFDNFHTFGMNNDVKPSDDSFVEVADVSNMKVFTGGSTNNMQYGNIYTHGDNISKKLVDISSITMPARYDDYNITIKNAHISPKTHNTMLYPLLVNEDKPITGTLNYTNYAGKHLSWSFAYTDEEYVNIIQPKDELINSYEYRYNAFYDTEYEFDNPYEIARYTSSASGVLPGFNTEFTGYTTVETDNGDGTYTVSIATDSLDNLPTNISFTANNLLTVDKLNTSKVTTMLQMFRSCGNLTRINCRLDTSSVTNEISQIFLGCAKLEYVDVTNLVGSNIKYASSLFSGCTLLTQIDGLNTWDTSELTNLTSMFNACSSLTSLSGIESWNVGKVEAMDQFVYKCTSLTGELNLSNWGISNCKNFASAFRETGLTEINLTNWSPAKTNTNMANMFRDDSSMTKLTAPTLVNANVNGLGYFLYECSSLTSLDISQWNVSGSKDLSHMFSGCSKLASLDLRNWDVSGATMINSFLSNCESLTDLKMNFVLNKADLREFIYGCGSLEDLSNMKLSGTVTSINGFAFHIKATSLDLSTLDCTYETIGMNIYTLMNSNITEFYPPTNISQDINLRYTTNLSIDSFVRIFNNLITTTETRTIMLHPNIVNSLTEEQIAIATNKGWTVTAP